MIKKPSNPNVILPTFPPTMGEKKASIFWMLWENPGITEDDFFLKLYSQKEAHTKKLKKKKELEQERDENRKRGKPVWGQNMKLKKLKGWFRALRNRRYGYDKQNVNFFARKERPEKRNILYPSLDFFFRDLNKYYTALVEATDTHDDLPAELHLRAFFLKKYYSPKKYKQFQKMFTAHVMDEPEYLLTPLFARYGITNPYELLRKYLEEEIFTGIYIMGFTEGWKKRRKTDSECRFAVDMARIHWPIFLAMGDSPLQRIYDLRLQR